MYSFPLEKVMNKKHFLFWRCWIISYIQSLWQTDVKKSHVHCFTWFTKVSSLWIIRRIQMNTKINMNCTKQYNISEKRATQHLTRCRRTCWCVTYILLILFFNYWSIVVLLIKRLHSVFYQFCTKLINWILQKPVYM